MLGLYHVYMKYSEIKKFIAKKHDGQKLNSLISRIPRRRIPNSATEALGEILAMFVCMKLILITMARKREKDIYIISHGFLNSVENLSVYFAERLTNATNKDKCSVCIE